MQPSGFDRVLAAMDQRPAPWIRVVVLIGAISCLALTMCHREQQAPRAPSNTTVPSTQVPTGGSAPAPRAADPAGSGASPQAGPAEPRPEYFPATKAPASLR